jgi:trehalose 6-phosphate phosphatase
MKPFFSCWEEIRNTLGKKNIFLFTDYDGTLAKIVRDPKRAKLGIRTRNILKKLLTTGKFHLSVISGRSIEEVKNFVSLPNVAYAGFHGLEIENYGIKIKKKVSLSYQKIFLKIKNKLTEWVRHFEYLHLEDKGAVLTLHYRNAPPDREKAIRRQFLKIVRESCPERKISILFGKKVLEIRPLGCDKGDAVKMILQNALKGKRKRFSVFYLGDDATDEDAFAFLSCKGITIHVGQSPSKADYYIKKQSEVFVFLNKLYASIKNALQSKQEKKR